MVLADFRYYFLVQMLDLPQWFPLFDHTSCDCGIVLPLIIIKTLNDQARALAFCSELINTFCFYFRGKIGICGSEKHRSGIRSQAARSFKTQALDPD